MKKTKIPTSRKPRQQPQTAATDNVSREAVRDLFKRLLNRHFGPEQPSTLPPPSAPRPR